MPARRGADRIHAALRTQERGSIWTLELPKGQLNRATAETLADEMIFLALAQLTGDAERGSALASTSRIMQSGFTVQREDEA